MASFTVAAGVVAPKQTGDHSATRRPFVGLRPKATNIPGQQQGQTGVSVSNGARVYCMQTVNPLTNAKFETMSYLPPLSPDSIAKEIDYMLSNGWIPCLEFDQKGAVFRDNSRSPGYYDGRYWTLWKLPMFGCNDPAPVLREIEDCKAAYPNAFIRVLGFDNIKQVQCISFIVQKPSSS